MYSLISQLIVGGAFRILGVVAMAIAILIVAWQSIHWLEYGVWVPMTLHRSLQLVEIPNISFEWRGVQQIWDVIDECPVSLYLFGVGLVLNFIGKACIEFCRPHPYTEIEMRRSAIQNFDDEKL